ncbi:MAG: DUF5050 domain-containing protein [Oscillospiraceae bacterium]|nr:DUF5050 domain-containing protein [Oscillospiraceae bacterium]
MKKILSTFLTAVMLITLFGCHSTIPEGWNDDTAVQETSTEPATTKITTVPEPVPEPEPLQFYPAADPNEKGSNTDGEWIYFSMYSSNEEEPGIYKMSTDGTQIIKLTDNKSFNINVIGDWVYSGNMSDGIFRMRTDGTELDLIVKGRIADLIAVGDWLYYIEYFYEAPYTESRQLFKIRTDGTEKTKLSKDFICYIHIEDDLIYYSTIRDVYKMNTDGTDVTQINGDEYDIFLNFIVSDGWIYYEYGGSGMFKMRLDGSELTQIPVSRKLKGFAVNGDWIYYILRDQCGSSRDGYLYRMRTDGSDKMFLITDDIIEDTGNITGDWLFYINCLDYNYADRTYKTRIHKLCPDGSDWQPFEGLDYLD